MIVNKLHELEKLYLYWEQYKELLENIHNLEADDQDFIDLGKAVEKWRIQDKLVAKLFEENGNESK